MRALRIWPVAIAIASLALIAVSQTPDFRERRPGSVTAPYADVISREVSVYTPPADHPTLAPYFDAVSREVSVWTPPEQELGPPIRDAVSREVSVWTPPLGDVGAAVFTDALSREISVQHEDTAAPVSDITAPLSNQLMGARAAWSIVGSARGQGFIRYRLQHGVGATPSTWTTFATKDLPVMNGLLGRFPVGLTQPIYTVRLLTLFTGGVELEDRVTIRLLSVTSPVVTQSFISPNADGVQDSTAVTCTTSFAASWLASVLSPAQSVVRQFAGAGTNVSFVWDGNNAGGQPVPDDPYTISITASDNGTGVISAPAATVVTVDRTPPTAMIASPTSMQTVLTDQALPILGEASDLNFTQYRVLFGFGNPGSTFSTLATSNVAVTGQRPDNVLHLFSVDWPNGVYTLKLEATDKAGNKRDLAIPLVLDQITFTDINSVPGVIMPALGQSAALQFTLSHTANVTVRIYEWPSKAFVRSITQPNVVQGSASVLWNGLDNQGQASTLEKLHYWTIEASDGFGRAGHYNDAQNPRMGFTGSWSKPSATVDAQGFNPYANDVVHVSATMVGGWAAAEIQATGTGLNFYSLTPARVIPPGVNTVVWDGRRPNGQIHSGQFDFYFTAPSALPYAPVYVRRELGVISDFRTEPYFVHPRFNEVSVIRYTLSRAGMVTVNVVDPNGNFIRTLVSALQGAGPQSVEWDGRDGNGRLFGTQGSYSIKVTHRAGTTISERIGSVVVY